jgi:hypothetical protein
VTAGVRVIPQPAQEVVVGDVQGGDDQHGMGLDELLRGEFRRLPVVEHTRLSAALDRAAMERGEDHAVSASVFGTRRSGQRREEVESPSALV